MKTFMLALFMALLLAVSPGAAAHAAPHAIGSSDLQKFDQRLQSLAESERGFGPVRLSEQAEFVYESGAPLMFWVAEDDAGLFTVFALQDGGAALLGLIERAAEDRTDVETPTLGAAVTMWRLSSTSADAPVEDTQTVTVERGASECSLLIDVAMMVSAAVAQSCGTASGWCKLALATGAVVLCVVSGPGSSDVYWYSGLSAERMNSYWSPSGSNYATADYYVVLPSCSPLHSSDGICRLVNGETVTTQLSVLIKWPDNWRTHRNASTVRTHYYGSTIDWSVPVYIPQRGEYIMSVHVNGSQKTPSMPTSTLSSSYGHAVRLMNYS